VLVLDTAPTGHLLRLLALPEILDNWLKAFFNIFLKYKNILRMPRLVQRLVALSKSLKVLRAWLQDPQRAALYAVSIPTEMARAETQDLLASARTLDVSSGGLLVNMVTPAGACALCNLVREREAEVLAAFRADFPNLPQTVIYQQEPPRGTARLAALGAAVYRKTRGFASEM
jgi:arsenite-transporting ATPase